MIPCKDQIKNIFHTVPTDQINMQSFGKCNILPHKDIWSQEQYCDNFFEKDLWKDLEKNADVLKNGIWKFVLE